MKKYSKPEICIEKFDMDIEILATVEMGSDLHNELKDTYKSTMVPAGAPETDEAFEAWVKSMGYDTPTSGLCYFTPTMPS